MFFSSCWYFAFSFTVLKSTLKVVTNEKGEAVGEVVTIILFSGHEPIYFIENKEKTLQASYDRDPQIVDYMD
jgi:hypothetical protein